MRTPSHTRSSRSENWIPWTWITIIAVILGVIFLNSYFSGRTDTSTAGSFLLVEPGSGSEVFIKTANNASKQISETEKFYTTDTSLSISSGFAHISSKYIDGYLDTSTELSYKNHTTGGEKIDFTRWRLWIESHGNNTLTMKNIEVVVKDGDIIMLEQPNQIFSTLYVLRGNVSISAGWINSQITSGKKIMVSKSDLANPWITLDKLTGTIDDSLKQNPLFILRNGSALLDSQNTTKVSTNSGGTTIWKNTSGSLLDAGMKKYIEITSPIDQSEITKTSIDVFGKILSSDVKRVTLNDIDAIVSPVDESFSLKWIVITNDIINIVYKVYSRESNLLERWVLTLYPKNRQSGVEKLTPNNFPINDKDYRVLSPTDNPYITTDTSVTVSGIVPKNTVQYILVNNYRLKKFVPYSSSWYYYANMDYDTMKDGINLYEIWFYGTNNQLLSTQLFTVVKEGKRAISGEVIQ